MSARKYLETAALTVWLYDFGCTNLFAPVYFRAFGEFLSVLTLEGVLLRHPLSVLVQVGELPASGAPSEAPAPASETLAHEASPGSPVIRWTPELEDAVTESARACTHYSLSTVTLCMQKSGTPRLDHVWLYQCWLYQSRCTRV